MQCKFCRYPIRNDKGKILPEKSILNIVDSIIIDDKLEYICFSHLNEPLMDKRIFDFIKYAKNRKLPVMIITNGLLFNSKDVINKLIDSNPDYIKFSLQTINSELFKKARGVNSPFQEYKEGLFEFLKIARGTPPEIIVDVACNFFSGTNKLKAILFGLERGDSSVYNTIGDLRNDVESFLIELQNFDGRFIFKSAELNSYLNKLKHDYSNEDGLSLGENISMKIKPFVSGKRLTDFFPIKNGIGCGNRILSILASGNVVPCCRVHNNMLNMGNIKKESLRSILERNFYWIKDIKSGRELPLVCQRCLGAPTRRGAFFKYIKSKLLKI